MLGVCMLRRGARKFFERSCRSETLADPWHTRSLLAQRSTHSFVSVFTRMRAECCRRDEVLETEEDFRRRNAARGDKLS